MRNTLNALRSSPNGLLVVGSFLIFGIVLFVGVGIAGSYALTVHYVQTSQQAQRAAEMKSARGECIALLALDHARAGFRVEPHGGASEHALDRLFDGIHGVVEHSACRALLHR